MNGQDPTETTPPSGGADDAASEPRIELRCMSMDDYDAMVEVTSLAYHGIGGQPWSREHIRTLLSLFPQGQLCISVDGRAVGFALSLVVDYSLLGDDHSYEDVIGDYRFTTHDPDGDVLYGIDVMVHDEVRGMRVAQRLYEARKGLCENLNLRAIVAGGRIPGYAAQAHAMSPQQYVQAVQRRELHDQVLSFQLANNFHVRRVMAGYLPFDSESKAYATLIEWNNLLFDDRAELHRRRKPLVRTGIVQMQVRPLHDVSQIAAQCEYYIDALAASKCDFALLPELFNMGLMAGYGDARPDEAIRLLAGTTRELRDLLAGMAVRYNINVVCGSMPVLEDGRLFNVAYLCRRDGSIAEQRKVHITPSERRWWGMVGGDALEAIDTDCGKVGILVCYDVEFPELSRRLADQGARILFVPFLTEMESGYQRVRHCARARAIENECYVAIAGAVGSLPMVKASDVHFAQSAMFTPSDHAFPSNCIISEAAPNSETLLVAEVNVDLLRTLHARGTVTTLKDRRGDLYEVRWRAGS